MALVTVVGRRILYEKVSLMHFASRALLVPSLRGMHCRHHCDGCPGNTVSGEMITMFPTSNTMVEFVHAFVDEDLAVILGMGTW